MQETGGSADVHITMIFGEEAFGCSELTGHKNNKILVHNPKVEGSDPLAQRGSVGWKSYFGCLVLNDDYVVNIESAAPTDAGL